jgi:menaquinone-dependent protoporphyrinogen IX oxidase
MVNNQHDLLIIYTSKNGRTSAMVEPIRQGMHEGGAITLVRTV